MIQLSIENLYKAFDKKPAVKNVSFDLQKQEVLTILGPNGAGKTTLTRLIAGSLYADSGNIFFHCSDGTKVPINPDSRRVKKMMGIVTQDNNIDPDFSCFDNLVIFARYFGITGKRAQTIASELLEKVSLTSYANFRSDQLSGGMLRRLVLARSLVNNPKVILLDEPTTGLDPDSRQEFWKLITDLKESGCSILLTTHYMEESERLADRIILFQNGEIIDCDSPQKIINKHIGESIVEISGISEQDLQNLSNKYSTWSRSIGKSYIISITTSNENQILEELTTFKNSSLQGIIFKKRPSGLDDVFLKLTGEKLQ